MSDTLRLQTGGLTEDILLQQLLQKMLSGDVAQTTIPASVATPINLPTEPFPSPIVPTAPLALPVGDPLLPVLGGTPSIQQVQTQQTQQVGAALPNVPVQDALQNVPSTDIAPRLTEAQEPTDLLGNLLAPVSQAPSESVQTLDSVQGEQGFLGRLGAGITEFTGRLADDPILRDELAQIAQALSAKSPRSFPFQLASNIRESAQGRQVEILRQATLDRLAGREPEDRIDLNTLTLSPELRQEVTASALGQVRTAAGIQATIAGIPSPQEREQAAVLTEAQIQATDALTAQRNVETLRAIQATGAQSQFEPRHFSLLDEIDEIATRDAVAAAGFEGTFEKPGGGTGYKFRNPQVYLETIDKVTGELINKFVNSNSLPEVARLLDRSKFGKGLVAEQTQAAAKAPPSSKATLSIPESSEAKAQVKAQLPSGAKYLGAILEGGVTYYYYDSTGNGVANKVLPIRQ